MSAVVRPARGSMVGARFSLTDHNGTPVTNESYRGRFLVVFFGFTHCRVVCPRALTTLSAVLDELGSRADQFQGLYVTVDPDRDTPATMKAFLEANYPHFTGLTGTADQIDAAKKEFRVFARRVADPEERDEYVVPHSAITYVLDRSGSFLTHFTESTGADELVRRLEGVLAAGGPL
ncbi:SCO family protein [Pseudonocardia sp. Cha107L01]|uniref:SCO family protein n=1 Tax=Pseudonocardia sp. Cha107L01 TaxID=3457576 RepID=UPI00403ED2A6